MLSVGLRPQTKTSSSAVKFMFLFCQVRYSTTKNDSLMDSWEFMSEHRTPGKLPTSGSSSCFELKCQFLEGIDHFQAHPTIIILIKHIIVSHDYSTIKSHFVQLPSEMIIARFQRILGSSGGSERVCFNGAVYAD